MGLKRARGTLREAGDSIVLKDGAADQTTLQKGANSGTAVFQTPNQTGTHVLVSQDSTDTLTNKSVDGGTNTLTNLPVSAFGTVLADANKALVRDGSGVVVSAFVVNANVATGAAIAYAKLNLTGSLVNADVAAAAAIARSKLAAGTANQVVVNDGSGVLTSEAALAASRGGLATNASAFTGLVKSAAGVFSASALVDADVSASAAVARSKLAAGTANQVVVNDGSGVLSSEAALAASRGGLGTSGAAFTGVVKASSGTFSASALVDADVATGAAIAYAKLAALTASRAVATNGSGVLIAAATTATELGYLSGVTSSIQTQIDGKQATSTFLTALAALATTGLVARTGSGTTAARTLTAGTGLSVTNGDGVSGDPTVALSTPVSLANGGTGQTSATAAFTALSPLTTKGDLLSYSTTAARVPVGGDGQVLTADSAQTLGVRWGTGAVTPASAGNVFSNGSSLQSVAFTGNANKVFGVNAGATSEEAKSVTTDGTGTDVGVTHTTGVITINLPSASATARGLVTTAAQTFAGAKTFNAQTVVATDNGYKITGSVLTSQWSSDSTNTSFDSSGSLLFRTNGTTNALMINTAQVPTFFGGNFRLAASSGGAGNASSPYMSPSDDTDTGFFFPGANRMGMTAGGSPHYQVNASSQIILGNSTIFNSTINFFGDAEFRRSVTTGVNTYVTFIDGSADTCGSITVNATANTTAYNTSSDQRLKTNFAAFDGLELARQIEAWSYNRFADMATTEYGVKAQQLASVYPLAVSAGGDDPKSAPWGVDYSKLVGILLRAVQQLDAEVTALKAAQTP